MKEEEKTVRRVDAENMLSLEIHDSELSALSGCVILKDAH